MEALRTIARQQGTTISAEEVLAVMGDEVWGHSSRRSGADYVTYEGEDDDGCDVYAPCSLVAHTLETLGWDRSEMSDWNDWEVEELIEQGKFVDYELFTQPALEVLGTAQMFAGSNTWGQCLAKARKNNELSGLGRN